MNGNPLLLFPELADKVANGKTTWVLNYGVEENFLHKIASSDDDFEQAFFQLAYDKLQGKLHNILPYLVGFEVVNKSDDNTKAVGIFGFKANNGQVLLIPAFFINGKIKDLDTIYSRNNNQFYPLNEDFAEIFMKDDTTGLGSPSKMRRSEFYKYSPPVDFRDLAIPPRTGRTVLASVTEYLEDSSNEVKEAFVKLMEKDAEFADSIAQFYPIEKLAEAMAFEDEEKKAAVLEVIYPEDLSKRAELTQEQKTEVLTKGALFIDKRAEASKFGLIDIPKRFTSVTSSGFYNYLTIAGTFNQALILVKPQQLRDGFSSNSILVVDFSTGVTYNIQDYPVFIREQITVKDFSSIHDKFENAADAQPSYEKQYVLIDKDLRASEPFRVVHNFKDEAGVRRLIVEPGPGSNCVEMSSPCSAYGYGTSTPQKFDNHFSKATEVRHVTLIFTKKENAQIEYRGVVAYVPKTFKLLEVNTSMYVSRPSGFYDIKSEAKKKQIELDIAEKEGRIKSHRPGTLCNFTSLLSTHGVLPMSVRSNGSDYFLNVGAAKRQYDHPLKAKIGLVLDVGLTEKAAEDILNLLRVDKPVHGQVKLAYTGDYTPPLIDEAPWANELGQSTYSGIPYVGTAPNDISYSGDPTRLGLGVKPEVNGIESEIQKATQLAQSGQKEIFDAHTIATMAKYVDPTNKVVSYIPNFVDSLDKLGRMLFMINWETDKFEKMYGNDDMPELMELLKDVFKNLGDLVIFLKRKYPDISINNNEQSDNDN